MNKNEEKFSIIPNMVLYTNKNSNNKSILEQLGYEHKVVCVIDYIFSYTGKGNEICNFTLEDIVMCCGYKPNKNKGRTNDMFKDVLSNLQELNYISSDVKMADIKPKELVKCKLTLDTSKEFASIRLSAKEKIFNAQDVDKAQLFAYYCYIVARMYKRSKEDGAAMVNGGRYEACFFGFELVKNDLRIGEAAITKYNDILVKLNLIRYKNFGAYYYSNENKHKTTRNSPNFYTLFDGDEEMAKKSIEEEFNRYCEDPLNRNKNFVKIKNDNRAIGGKKGSLIRKLNAGTITDEEKLELANIEEYFSSDFEEKQMIRDTFEEMKKENLKMLLSEYLGEDFIKYRDKFSKIETDLGLVKNGKLIVEFVFYEKIMSDYNVKTHDKIVERIKNEIENNNGDWGESNPMEQISEIETDVVKESWQDEVDRLFG